MASDVEGVAFRWKGRKKRKWLGWGRLHQLRLRFRTPNGFELSGDGPQTNADESEKMKLRAGVRCSEMLGRKNSCQPLLAGCHDTPGPTDTQPPEEG